MKIILRMLRDFSAFPRENREQQEKFEHRLNGGKDRAKKYCVCIKLKHPGSKPLPAETSKILALHAAYALGTSGMPPA